MNIFVGNLSFDANEGDVKKLFEGFGNVVSVAIVMEKEKKAPKSRGFGFVDMPDEQQALAAIAALNGKEFMGRVLIVNPVRPKTEAQAASRLRENGQPGTYKGGRRTHSYTKRRGLAGMQEEDKSGQRSQDNPMRWRKGKDQAKPWHKSPGEHKPWKKTEGEARPWKKSAGDVKPWKKSAGDAKPWHKSPGEHKPWKKTEGEARPWKKAAGDAKPWSKSNGRPQKSRFKGSKNPGGYKK